MVGWLVVNCFIKSEKFSEIYEMLVAAARAHSIKLELKTTADIMCSQQSGFEQFVLPDFILFWDKDICLAKRLENAGVRLFNSSTSIELCDNKALNTIALSKAGICTPETFFSPETFPEVNYNNFDFLVPAAKALGFPMVIKEAYGSFGQQVYLADSLDEAKNIISRLKYVPFIMQRFISTSRGRDVRINVVGGKVIASMLRVNENDFRSNITNGGEMKSFIPTAEQEKAAVKACEALGLDFAGVDVLFGENDEPVICEVNSNPHFKSTFECTGIDMAAFVMEHIRESLK